MSDQPFHMIVNLSINDVETYRTYEKGFFGLLKKHGGEFVTFDDNSETFEGFAPLEDRVIIFKFPNAGAAKQLYADPDYQALAEHRREGTTLKFLTMVNCPTPRS